MTEATILLVVLLAYGLRSLPKFDDGMLQLQLVGGGILSVMWMAGVILLKVHGIV